MNEMEKTMENVAENMENVAEAAPEAVNNGGVDLWKGFGMGFVAAGAIALGYEFLVKPYMAKRALKKVVEGEAKDVTESSDEE